MQPSGRHDLGFCRVGACPVGDCRQVRSAATSSSALRKAAPGPRRKKLSSTPMRSPSTRVSPARWSAPTIVASRLRSTDKWTPSEQREERSPVAAAGIPVWIDARARIAHERALIIDRRVTIMGSYNFSAGAAFNSEDMNIVASAEVAEAYAAHRRARLAGAVPFADAVAPRPQEAGQILSPCRRNRNYFHLSNNLQCPLEY
jgi:phosphatidylserine/phosphatidylglycerophosphate/cardiolipin synthase-like enzyme